MLSKALLNRLISTGLVFLQLLLPPLVFAQSFESSLQQGKDLGKVDVQKYAPGNLNQTLQQRGLGTADNITPRIDEARGQKSNYTRFYNNPSGMGNEQGGEAGQWVETSYDQRQKFDLSRDTLFGSQCLQRDAEGKCTMWSLSKDLITNNYPDCEKVAIPHYGATWEQTCTGTNQLTTVNCDIRTITSITTEEVQGPCNQITIELHPGQIYAVCRDNFDIYRVFKGRYSVRCDHYARCHAYLCQENRCTYCRSNECPLDTPVLQNESELPSGAVLLGRGATNVVITGDSGSRVMTYSLYDFYILRKPSIIERVIFSKDSPCGANLDRWFQECAIRDYLKCDQFGLNCVALILNHEATGETVSKQCQNFASTIENYQTTNCQLVCSEEYTPCREDCTGYSGIVTCDAGRNRCRSDCDDVFEQCNSQCIGTYNSCVSGCGGNQTCLNECLSQRDACQSGCGSNKTLCYGNCEENYQTCLPCVAQCQSELCQEECEIVQVQSGYNICSLPESAGKIEINSSIATQTPYRHTFTTTEKKQTVTWQTLMGGPGVDENLNDWWSKVFFVCGEESDSCQALIEQGCYLHDYECLDPDCTQIEYTYRCGRGGVTHYTVAYNCAGDIRCIGTDCVDASYEANTDFASVAAAMEVLNQLRVDSQGMYIFPGEKQECVRTQGCCKTPKGGVTVADYVNAARNVITLYNYAYGGLYGTTWANYANAFTYILTGGEAGSLSGLLGTTVSEFLGTTTSTLWTSSGTIVGEAAVTLGAEVAVEGAVTTVAIDTALISTLATLATIVSIVLVVYSIIKFLWDWYFECERKDIITSQKVGLRLCHRVGERCCKKLLGMCTKHCRVYCCFNSILARIIHQQGRPQVGISWGSAERPNCRGFTPEELASIDFSKIDFSEYMQYVKHKTEVSQEEIDELVRRIKQRYDQ